MIRTNSLVYTYQRNAPGLLLLQEVFCFLTVSASDAAGINDQGAKVSKREYACTLLLPYTPCVSINENLLQLLLLVEQLAHLHQPDELRAVAVLVRTFRAFCHRKNILIIR